MIISRGMESRCSKFISVRCLILLLLIATHCFPLVLTVWTVGRLDECSALWQFKQSFSIDESASGERLSCAKIASWTQHGGERSNCCSWDGVECDEDSGHVIGLDLRSSCLHGSIISSSSLFDLVHLQRLDLSDNDFNYSGIPSRLGHDLTSLTYLNLSSSVFSGQIPSEISMLSKLSTLDLSANVFNGNSLKLTKTTLGSLVQNSTNLKQLHLSMVEIYSTVPDILVNASSLTSLKVDSCGLYGEFLVGIFHLPNLEVLYVSYNSDLTGYFPTFNKSNVFKKLDVANTNFSGQLPTTIGNLHSLNLLDMSFCNFSPLVPSSSLRNLTQLSYLSMSSFNDVSKGKLSISFSWVGKLTKLNHLSLGDTNIKGEFLSFVANLTQLEYLNLAANEISGQIPSWLMKLTQLTTLSLGDNNLQGPIPRSLFQLKSLEYLLLSGNNLSGLVEFDQFSKLKKLKGLELSNNMLSVEIRNDLSATLPKLQTLALGFCNLTEFPNFLKNQSQLTQLDLSDNYIHGRIPKWVWNATRDTLSRLYLYNNFLTGFDQNQGILPWTNLTFLTLGSNMLQGPLPIPPQSIRFYAVDNNEYTGEISQLFCNLNNLYGLELSNNHLSGMLPQCLGNSSILEILDLHNNFFHGPPICPNSLRIVDLSHNHLQGKLPRALVNCTQLNVLNFGNNQMSDIFPSWLGALPELRILILRSNGFHGLIGKPTTKHVFPKLRIIDLSNNGFSGMLPSNYLEIWNSMKYVDESQQIYFQVHSNIQKRYTYTYSMIIHGKGVELKYKKTLYLLKLIDLSSNRFEGEIPAGIMGNLKGLVLLNLANNTLTGCIPSSLGDLTVLESLDLSQNKLSGRIPNNLAQLTFLAYFNVSHNHLSGPIPLGKQFDTFQEDSYQGKYLSQNKLSGRIPNNLAQLTFLAYFNVSHNHLSGPIPLGKQFDTFQEDSYQGNSGLCGKPLSKKCEDSESSMQPPSSIVEEDEDSGFQIALDWYVVLPGIVSGLIVGVVVENIWITKKHEWFVDTFSRRRKPRGTRARRGRRT